MGTGIPSWSAMVGSALAIQAGILMTGFLLGLNQRLEPQGPPARAESLAIHQQTARLAPFDKASELRNGPSSAEGARPPIIR